MITINPEALRQLQTALNDFNQSAIEAAMAVSSAIEQAALNFFNAGQRTLTVTERLERFGLFAVDPHELSPEGRWEYQKWVLSAPYRWAQRVCHSVWPRGA
jgi:hypothetical protein